MNPPRLKNRDENIWLHTIKENMRTSIKLYDVVILVNYKPVMIVRKWIGTDFWYKPNTFSAHKTEK